MNSVREFRTQLTVRNAKRCFHKRLVLICNVETPKTTFVCNDNTIMYNMMLQFYCAIDVPTPVQVGSYRTRNFIY